MRLHFLGQTYHTTDQLVETIPSDLTAHFRGQSYQLRRPIQTYQPHFCIRKYRGILYLKS
ncbi:MAG: DUF4278 domain-containing protein [Waterburya sp.]